MTGTISTNNDAIQSGTSDAANQLAGVLMGPDGKPLTPGVDPRLTAAVDDTAKQNRRGGDRADDAMERTRKDSEGKTALDKAGMDKIGGIGTALLSAAGSGVSSLLGTASSGAGQTMPQVPTSTPGQNNTSPLSSPKAAQELARLLSGDSSGRTGLTSPGGPGATLGGPRSPGSTLYEQRIIELARNVVAAEIPYSWGSGDLNGPTQSGNTSNAAAYAAGDHLKAGFDCSALARYLVYQASGVEIPRVSGDQYAAGALISPADARPGDLAFNTDPNQHVQVYVGDGMVVEAQQSGTNVMFSEVDPGTQFVRVVA